LASSLGWIPRYNLFLQETVSIGIRTASVIKINSEFAKILKGIARDKVPYKRRFPSSPMSRHFLVRPRYQIFVSGDEKILADLTKSLEDPQRPLYLGQSDDFVIVDDVSSVETEKTTGREMNSAIEGIYPECEVVTLPYRYSDSMHGPRLEYRTLSIPQRYPFDAGKEVPCYRFGKDLFVQLF